MCFEKEREQEREVEKEKRHVFSFFRLNSALLTHTLFFTSLPDFSPLHENKIQLEYTIPTFSWGPILGTTTTYAGGSSCVATSPNPGATCTTGSPFRGWYGYPSTFPKPLDITTDDRGYVYVSMNGASKVSVFDQDLSNLIQDIPTLTLPHGCSLVTRLLFCSVRETAPGVAGERKERYEWETFVFANRPPPKKKKNSNRFSH